VATYIGRVLGDVCLSVCRTVVKLNIVFKTITYAFVGE
jgi:hypothetical protein